MTPIDQTYGITLESNHKATLHYWEHCINFKWSSLPELLPGKLQTETLCPWQEDSSADTSLAPGTGFLHLILEPPLSVLGKITIKTAGVKQRNWLGNNY